MKFVAVALSMAVGLALSSTATAQSEMPPLEQNPRLTFEYRLPTHPIYGYHFDPNDARVAKQFSAVVKRYESLSGVRQRLMKRRLLEEFGQFLAPVKFPIPLRLVAEQCDTVNAFYDYVNSRIILCYEFVENLERIAPKVPTPQGITAEEVIVGGVVGVMLHEGGHAISNLLRLPVLGREEDTADQIAGFVMTQFGRDIARTTIKGFAYFWYTGGPGRYWGFHSTPLQRARNYLCIAYGADPEGFEDFVKFGWLPKERIGECANEFRQVQQAFRSTIMPHLDMELMKRVQARKWLQPDDGKRP